MMSDISARLRRHMRQHGLTQAEVGRRAGVSQATVSRALSGPSRREGAGHSRLFNYLQLSPDLPERALDAVRQVWDGTPEHEGALARLIEASGDLWPRLRKE